MKVIVLGGGSLGRTVAEALSENTDVVIVEKNEEMVTTLRDSGFKVVVGDFRYSATLIKAGIEEADIVVLTSSNPETIKITLQAIRRNNKTASILLYLPREIEPDEFLRKIDEESDVEIKVDVIVHEKEATRKELSRSIKQLVATQRSKELLKKLESIKVSGKTLGIVMHDNPDPDSMATAFALQEIAERVGLKTLILYGGEITHHENLAFSNLLGIEAKRVSRQSFEIKRCGAIALVDCQPNGNVTILDESDLKRVEIVIDHHQINKNLEKIGSAYVDIRPNAGSTSGIMVEYLRGFKIEPNENLATALFYGMYIDTKRFSRLTEVEIKALPYLVNYVNRELLEKIENPDVSLESAEIMAKAITNRKHYKNVVISNVGFVSKRDALAEAADFLIRLEGVSTVLVFGVVDDQIEMSARTRDVRVNIGKIMNEAFGDLGSGGGHSTMGGARVPLGIFKLAKDRNSLLRLAEEAITERFLQALGMSP